MILCLIFSITSVSASDVNTTDNQVLSSTPNIDTLSASVNTEQNNNTQSVSENNLLSAGSDSGSNDLLGAEEETGSFTDLDKLIKLSQDKLVLPQNYKYNPDTDSAFADGITISKTLNIDGNGFTIDRTNNGKIFTINANNVTLKNMYVINFQYGFNIYGSNCTISNITAVNSTSLISDFGENNKITDSTCINLLNSIRLQSGSANFEVINCTFNHCRSSQYVGSALWASVAATGGSMSNCTIIDNYAQGSTYVAAIYIQRTDFKCINSKFINNSFNAANYQHIFYQANSLVIDNCYFEGNIARTSIVQSNGELTITNSYFTKSNNVFSIDPQKYLYADNCTFNNTIAAVSTGNSADAQILNSKFIDISGSVINSKSMYCNIENCSFINCNGKTNLGAPIGLYANKTIVSNCSFTNTSGTLASAINTNNYNINLKDNIYNNDSQIAIYGTANPFDSFPILYASVDGNGAGLSIEDCCNLETALNKINSGGIIYLKEGVYNLTKTEILTSSLIGLNKNVIINDYSFTMNQMFTSIENITFNNTKNRLTILPQATIKDCIFKNITLDSAIVGSAEYTTSYGFTVDNVIFDNCVATYCIYMGEHFKIMNVDILHSNFNRVFQQYHRCNDMYYENIYLYDVTSTNEIIYSSGDQKDLGKLYGFKVINSTFTYFINDYDYFHYTFDDINITNCTSKVDYLFTNNANCLFNNIVVENTTVNSYIFKMDYDLSVTNSLFKNITGISYIFYNNHMYNLDNVNFSTFEINKLGNYDMIGGLNNIHFTKTNFTSGIIFTLGNDMVLADSSFTDFMGHVVVAGNNIVIRDTNFTRGNNSDLNGSAIYGESGDFLTIENCRFTSNNASYGGAVYTNINPTAIMKSTFTDNRALAKNETNPDTSCGGAIYIGDVYNSIDDFTKSYLSNTINYNDLRLVNPNKTLFTVIYVVPYWQTYKNNESFSGDGSGKDINNPTNISDARIKAGPYCEIYFINNHDWTNNYYNMTNTTINPDHVGEFVVRYSGMVFYGNNSIIDNLYFTVDATNTTFKDLTFANNTGHSALVINQEDTVVDNCTFLNNGGENVNRGAAIQILANNTSILNSTFTGNLAGNISGANGGAVFINASYISISDCHFSDNQAYTTGSHLFVVDDNELHDISLIDCNFTGGSVYGSGMSSGVYLSGDNLVVYNSNFTDNIGRQGAGLTVTGSTINLNITGNNFTDNRAVPQGTESVNNNFGGAVFFDSSRGPVSIVDNIFTGNNASVGGGALYINNMPGSGNTFAGNVFSDNHALSGNGGAVYVNKVDYPLTLSGGEFTDNNATGNGGALYVNAPVNINGAIFNGNNATLDGGAIYNNNTLSLNSNAFNGNGAVNGGAIYNNGVLVDKGSRYISNTATRDGGAIYSKSDLDYTAASSSSRDFVGNRAVNGGALYINGTNNNIRGALFTGNYADYGSCIYVENNTDLNVYGTSIVDNHVANGSQATGGHGDIYLGNVVNFAIPDDGLYLEPQTTGSSTYDQYIYNSTNMVRSDVLYVSESGTGLGLMSSEPTTLDKALEAINDNGRIIFVDSYMLNTATINRNVTLAGYNNTISMKRNNTDKNKYLFNQPKNAKNKKKLCKNISFQLIIYPPI